MKSTAFQTDAHGAWLDQQAGADLDYTLDWSDFLEAGDVIVSSSWTATPGLIVDRRTFTDATTGAWCHGGIAGRSYLVSNTITTNAGRRDVRSFRVCIRSAEAVGEGLPSVFPSLGEAVASLRRDQLLGPSQTWMAGVEISDEFLVDKLRGAERAIERRLRIFLTPTEVLPFGALQSERDALDDAGARWVEEPGYDHSPAMLGGDTWGRLELRHTPVIAVHSVRFAYPDPTATVFEVPPSWLRIDRKYGVVEFVPTQAAGLLGFSSVVLTAMHAGRRVPLAMQVRYRVGLDDVPRKHPDLLNIIKRQAVLDVLDDQLLPSSGSSSVDGLSQSLSWDSSGHQEALDAKIEAVKTSLQGIRLMVV